MQYQIETSTMLIENGRRPYQAPISWVARLLGDFALEIDGPVGDTLRIA